MREEAEMKKMIERTRIAAVLAAALAAAGGAQAA